MKRIGFIGCGNMGGALLKAVAQKVEPSEICFCEADDVKAQNIEKNIGAQRYDLKTLCSQSSFVVIGVKPQVVDGLLEEVAKYVQKDTIFISMCAGVSIDRILNNVKNENPVIRIMPNTPASVGEGMILYATTTNVTKENEQDFLNMFDKAGKILKIAEDKIDAGCALSGSGPAYVFMFAEALADGGVECGLTREQAQLLAAQTLYGAAKMLLQENAKPAVLKDAVCSPGGTTIAGVHALEEDGFRVAAMDAVKAAYERSKKL